MSARLEVCYGLFVSPQRSHIEPLNSKYISVLRDGASKEVMKVKRGPEGEALTHSISVLPGRDSGELAVSLPEHTQRKGHVRTQRKCYLQARKTALTRNQP